MTEDDFERALHRTTVWYVFCCVWGGLLGRWLLRRAFEDHERRWR